MKRRRQRLRAHNPDSLFSTAIGLCYGQKVMHLELEYVDVITSANGEGNVVGLVKERRNSIANALE